VDYLPIIVKNKMKRIITAGLLTLCIGTIMGVDLESYQFIDRLLSLNGPGAPVIYENAVIFTAPSSHRRVGISFAHEGFSKVYWLRKLVIPKDPSELALVKNTNADPYQDSGLLFHVQDIPDGIREMDYRLIIDGLWTADPLNPKGVMGSGGLLQSRVSLPPRSRPVTTYDSASGLRISYNASPGEFITIAGSFNGWDPFMYEMRETSPGSYTFTLALPPGTYHYVFFYRGQRLLDPHNPNIAYTKDGKIASEAIIR
jgi:hypothetical protein